MQTDFTQILTEHQALLSRVAASYEANESIQQELLQDIALAVWQGLNRFNQQSSLKTYILRIAHNRAISHVAKAVKSRDLHQPDQDRVLSHAASEHLEPDLAVEKQRDINVLLDAVRALPVNMRQVMTLALEGLSYQEIGDVCGINKNHVGVLIQRAKQRLQQSMSHE